MKDDFKTVAKKITKEYKGAFPATIQDSDGRVQFHYLGMTARFYAACKIMPIFIREGMTTTQAKMYVASVFELADLMVEKETQLQKLENDKPTNDSPD